MIRRWSLGALVTVLAVASTIALADATSDPLPSWNEGAAKTAIVDFVKAVTTEGGPKFVPTAQRVAVFDNDGTLWPENPIPFQLAFTVDELKRLAPDHPEWKENPAIQAALNGQLAVVVKMGMEGLVKLLQATHSGMTTEEFDTRVRDWIRTARHPRYDRPYNDLTYQPMQELLTYLQSMGFKTYIVSGGGADFMRAWAEETYAIPPEQVIGSYSKTKYELRDGMPTLIKEGAIELVDDHAGKPVGIHRFIGRRPILCFGNSDGDENMLEWTTIGRSPSLGLILHHTDADREYAYDREPKSTGKLTTALDNAPKRGWVVIDMKTDWGQVFSPSVDAIGPRQRTYR